MSLTEDDLILQSTILKDPTYLPYKVVLLVNIGLGCEYSVAMGRYSVELKGTFYTTSAGIAQWPRITDKSVWLKSCLCLESSRWP